jgi:gas vesicle protein
MGNLDKNSKTFLTGALIGGVLGVCAVSIYSASKKGGKHKSHMNVLGKAVAEMGDILSSKKTAKMPVIHTIGKKIHKHEDSISDAIDLISSGIHLWEKFRKEV